MKTLVIGLNWLGDVIMSLPTIYAISHTSETHIITRPHLADVYQLLPASANLRIHQIATNDWFARVFCAASPIRRLKADKAIVLPDSFRAAMVAKLCSARASYGFSGQMRDFLLNNPMKKPSDFKQKHESDLHFMLAQAAGLVDSKPELPVFKPDSEQFENILSKIGITKQKDYFVFAPGAAFGSAKRWPPEKFAELASILTKHYHLPIIITGGASEAQMADDICKNGSGKIINAAGKTSIPELAVLIKYAKCLVANDSGTMHLGAVTRTPTAVPVGPTDMIRTGPLNKRFIAVKNNLCSIAPCRQRVCKHNNHVCMQAITAEQMFEAVKQAAENNK